MTTGDERGGRQLLNSTERGRTPEGKREKTGDRVGIGGNHLDDGEKLV